MILDEIPTDVMMQVMQLLDLGTNVELARSSKYITINLPLKLTDWDAFTESVKQYRWQIVSRHIIVDLNLITEPRLNQYIQCFSSTTLQRLIEKSILTIQMKKSIFSRVCYVGYTDCLKLLLDKYGHEDHIAHQDGLLWAVSNDNIDILKLLLAYQPLNFKYIKEEYMKVPKAFGHGESLKLLLSDPRFNEEVPKNDSESELEFHSESNSESDLESDEDSDAYQ
ncbi:hypothetical protein BC833DRAFT_598744 [Globomyces pollinis-pini]|nr:hypothetical protein BC833DRAFT_598744 [Globomyces pollinis-pini]